MKIHSSFSWQFIIVVISSAFLLFLRLGEVNLAEWDESRNGANAFEMYYNGDLINLYFNGTPDTWNNKPPLMIWLITISYRVFGFNEFALRFPSAIAAVIFFLVFFKLISLYKTKNFALICCLLLMSCKAIIGHHAGKTGDFDALMLLFLTLSVYYFLLYIDFKKERDIIFSFLALCAAFYTKGTAAFLLIPCFIAYAALNKKLFKAIKDRKAWWAIFVFVVTASSWVVAILLWGEKYHSNSSGSTNALFTLFKTDTIDRITGLNNETTSNNTYIFTVLDAKLNLWNYLLYAAVIFFLVKALTKTQSNYAQDKLLVIALVFSVLITIQILLMQNKHVWYLIPAFPFYAIVILSFIVRIKYLMPVFILLLVFTFTRQVHFILNQKSDLHTFFISFKTEYPNSSILIKDMPTQDLYLYILWSSKNVVADKKPTELSKGNFVVHNSENPFYKGRVLLKHKNSILTAIDN